MKVYIARDWRNQNVIITSLSLAGVGWFTSVLEKAFNIEWNYEIGKFEATRKRVIAPKGFCTTWNADVKLLIEKEHWDKVIVVQRGLKDFCYAHALYHRPFKDILDIVIENPLFFKNIRDKWAKIEIYREFKHEKFLFLDLEKLNLHTVAEFNRVFEFLEIPKSEYPFIVPVKVWRNWECYSNIAKSGDDKLYGQLPYIKEMFFPDMKLKNIKGCEEPTESIVHPYDKEGKW